MNMKSTIQHFKNILKSDFSPPILYIYNLDKMEVKINNDHNKTPT